MYDRERHSYLTDTDAATIGYYWVGRTTHIRSRRVLSLVLAGREELGREKLTQWRQERENGANPD